MISLFNIPDDVWCELLSDWLEMGELGRLDSAVVNRSRRHHFQLLLSAMSGVRLDYSNVDMANWIYCKGMRIKMFYFFYPKFTGGCLPYCVHFKMVMKLDFYYITPDTVTKKRELEATLTSIINACTNLKGLTCPCDLIVKASPTILNHLLSLSVTKELFEEALRLIEEHSQHLFEFSVFAKSYSVDHCRQVLLNNKQLKNITIPGSDMTLVDTVIKHGPALSDVYLDWKGDFAVSVMSRLISELPLLENCMIRSEGNNRSIIVSLSERRKAPSLMIKNYPGNDLRSFVMSCRDLTSFELLLEKYLQPEAVLIQVLKHSAHTLRRLRLNDCEGISLTTFKRVVTSCPNLVELRFLLKKPEPDIIDLFTKGCVTPCPLQIISLDCPYISLNLVMDIISACPSLRQGTFHNVSDDFQLQEKFRTFLRTSLQGRRIEVTVYFSSFDIETMFDTIPMMKFEDGVMVNDIDDEMDYEYYDQSLE